MTAWPTYDRQPTTGLAAGGYTTPPVVMITKIQALPPSTVVKMITGP
jgi:hypothetical protein